MHAVVHRPVRHVQKTAEIVQQHLAEIGIQAKLNLPDWAIAGSALTAFNVSGGSVSVTYGGSIAKDSDGNAITVSNQTGGTVSFNGTVSSTGASDGIGLQNNSGATVSFTNTLTLDTSASGTAAFSATGGGSVNASGSGSTINSGAGTALNVVNTTIGASDLTFQSIPRMARPMESC